MFFQPLLSDISNTFDLPSDEDRIVHVFPTYLYLLRDQMQRVILQLSIKKNNDQANLLMKDVSIVVTLRSEF